MTRVEKNARLMLLLVAYLLVTMTSVAQEGFDNSTRALYIFDMARYIDYGEDLKDKEFFRISVLDNNAALFWEMGNLARTRTRIQDKPVDIVYIREENKIIPTQILYVNKNSGFDLMKVKEMIKGQQTMLITEGYDFNESMINFIVVEGKPRYQVHEDKIIEAGMSVNQLFLYQAIKTKEDWENLFDLAMEEIELQKQQIMEQQEVIEAQRAEIVMQKALLDSLDRAIEEKERVLIEKQQQLDSQMAQIGRQGREIVVQRSTIETQQKEVAGQREVLTAQREEIAAQLTKLDEQLLMIGQQEDRIKTQLATLEKQKLILWFVSFMLLLFIFLAYIIYRNYRIKKEANVKLEEKNRTITAQKDEIEKQRDIAAMQRDQIAYQKKHITDSIEYAKRIQTALLPSLELFSDDLDHFVFFKPLDIVSGDFYWVTRRDNLQIIIAADCTGHGVPGAFMSMLGVTMLNEIVLAKNVVMPDQILNNLRSEIISSLKQSEEDDKVKDGMDMAVCVVDFSTSKLYYAGANNPLYLIRGNELIHYRPDKMPVAIHYRMGDFTLHTIDLQKGDCFYIFSDGYADQFGGPDHRKFMSARLKEELVKISEMPMIKQGERLNDLFVEWQGDNPQIDDVTLIGVRY
ncbi:MAG: YfiR/HmsC family protein [Bacteroidales bacterium]